MSEIRQMTFSPPGGAAVSVETMSFGRLRELDRGRSQRGDFFVVGLVADGIGSIVVDYRRFALGPRSVVWIGPGVVHQWMDISGLDGDIVLFTPTAPVAPSARILTSMPGIGTVLAVDAPDWSLIQSAAAHLRSELAAELAAPGSPPEILGSLLSALILRATPEDQLAAARNDIFQRFRAAVETGLSSRHDVEFYAGLLGYSARTLSRAARSTTGQSAKAYVSERVILEAKRLLAHEQCSLRETSSRLGFSDSSVFSAFFRRETGITPGAWRDQVLGPDR